MDFLLVRKAIEQAKQIDYPAAKVVKFLELIGARILLGYKSEYRFIGETNYSKNIIKIGNLNEEETLFTLLHEGGHYLSNLRLKHFGLKWTSFEREFWAYQHGWLIARWLFIKITKEAWTKFHEKELKAYDEFKLRQKRL